MLYSGLVGRQEIGRSLVSFVHSDCPIAEPYRRYPADLWRPTALLYRCRLRVRTRLPCPTASVTFAFPLCAIVTVASMSITSPAATSGPAPAVQARSGALVRTDCRRVRCSSSTRSMTRQAVASLATDPNSLSWSRSVARCASVADHR